MPLTLCDLLISGSLFYILTGARAQTPYKAMESLLTRLSVMAVQTGCITAVPAGMQLVAAVLDDVPVSVAAEASSDRGQLDLASKMTQLVQTRLAELHLEVTREVAD
ncbi:hypothetical protein PLICRDRAFT_176759 [Plicaturopsis crispa FD-325 SS-3]|nr:hypothetical protein PLICRDRAFT_176759 [Plicaturopsis crispa FD-325 SS-3]